MLTNVYLGSGHNGNQEDVLSSRQFGQQSFNDGNDQQSFNDGNKQARMLVRCDSYLPNLKLSMHYGKVAMGRWK